MTSREDQIHIGRKRIEQVFRYLEALNQHRNPAKRRLDEQLWNLWLRDLPDHPCVRVGTLGASTNSTPDQDPLVQAAGDDFVLRVRRPKLTKCPSPPDSLLPWLERGWEEPSGSVTVRSSRNEIARGQTIVLSFGDDTTRIDLLKTWRSLRESWAANELLARAAMTVFEKLYEIRGQIEREGENVELVLGDGTLSWKQPDGNIFHPIILQRLQLEFDPKQPEFTLVEADMPVELYSALFQSMPAVEGKTIATIRADLEQGKYHPLGKEDTSGFLRSVAAQLSPHGEFRPTEAARADDEHPVVGRSPVVFLRRRNLGFAVALDAAIQAIASAVDIPQSLLRIVGIEHSAEDATESGTSHDWVECLQPTDVLLSKPANAEQIRIAQRLDGHGSVLVQGPPGTGKTHTIANLLGHLLAQGKSVLITSHTTKALRVLRSHVVQDLQPLCVSVLDSDMESRKQLESSVDSIVSRLSLSDAGDMERRATELRTERAKLLDRYREVVEKLLHARFDEFRDLVLAGKSFSPSDAARAVSAGADHFAFIPGPVELGSCVPLSESELGELYRTNALLTADDEAELLAWLPPVDKLPTPNEFADLLAQRTLMTEASFSTREDLWAPGALDVLALEAILQQSERTSIKIRNASLWQTQAMLAGLHGTDQASTWKSLLSLIDEAWSLKASSIDLILTHEPSLPSDWPAEELQTTAEEIWLHVTNGGGLSVARLVTRPTWKRFLREARVTSGGPKRSEHFDALRRSAQLNLLRVRLVSRWGKQITPLGGPAASELGEEPEVACRQLSEMIRRCLSWHVSEWEPFESAMKSNGFNFKRLLDEQPPRLLPGGELMRLADTLDGLFRDSLCARIAQIKLGTIDQRLRQAYETLSIPGEDEQGASVAGRLRSAIESEKPDLYRDSYLRLQDLYDRRKHLSRRRELLDKLRPVASGWAASIAARVGLHGNSHIPPSVAEAWQWRQLNDELDQRANVSLVDLQDGLSRLERAVKVCTAELIEQLAWAAQLRRTERNLQQKQALVGWLDTVKKIGKGTGIRVPKLKAEANRLMTACRGAVPVWIMPLSRVADNFDPRTARFDVVIIDEASQSDVMGLLALSMADKAIVVGDHEQVSPSAVGQDLTAVQHLIDEFLDGVPNAHLYDGQTSIYDLARQSFGGTIRLVEHFRCVPEIIQFSNQLSYEGAIRPLRDASSVTLKPHVIAHRVNNAFSEGKRNEAEASELAALLIAATEQPEYTGKTFGVISLVGDEQAFLIDSILRRNLSEERFKLKHNILCGNPAQFQGDERDVVFLSVVDSSDGGVLRTREEQMFKQRFNVAASRARDQMWVVHSLDARSHLKPGDLRRKLIEYAEDPTRILKALESIETKVDSEFELEVAARLTRLGFRIIPQWRVGHYRIDLVVEGSGKRLAVECDGDRYHPIEKLPDDMARQAVLERLGWTFVRLRGSQFFRNPDNAMGPLLARLNNLGIEPAGNTDNQVTSVDAKGQELRDRVMRRAQEIRRSWQSDSDSVSQERTEDKEPTTGNSHAARPTVVQRDPAPRSAAQAAGSDAGAQRDAVQPGNQKNRPLNLEEGPSIVGKTKRSENISDEDVWAAVQALVPRSGLVELESLVLGTSKVLGFETPDTKLIVRINKVIGAKAGDGRLQRDPHWKHVWRNRE
jgi:very-short-patch-repair endonuclease